MIEARGVLGAGSYNCFIQGQGGVPLVDVLQWRSISFSRRLDTTSSGSVSVGAGSSLHLGEVDAWSHELSIWRDEDEAWVGPLQNPSWAPEEVVLDAADLFVWLDRRLLDRHDRNYINVDAALIFGQLVNDAMEPDRSPSIEVATSPTGTLATRKVEAAQAARASDVLNELARTALDYTCVGRRIRAGGLEVPGATSFMLTDDTLLSPKLESRGVDAATQVVVLGSGTTPVMGRAGGPAAGYGLVQQAFNESTIEDPGSALAAANTRWEFLHEPPKYLSGTLSPTASVGFDELIPGSYADVRLSVLDRKLMGLFRLAQVDVTVNANETGIEETVDVTLEPLGSVAVL